MGRRIGVRVAVALAVAAGGGGLVGLLPAGRDSVGGPPGAALAAAIDGAAASTAVGLSADDFGEHAAGAEGTTGSLEVAAASAEQAPAQPANAPADNPPQVDLADVAGEDLRPGLLAVYRSLVDGSTLARIEPKPAFTVGRGSPHPRLPPGPFAVAWTGVVLLPAGGELMVSATVGGELTVMVDDQVVLAGTGRSETAVLRGAAAFSKRGPARIKVEFRSLPEVPARVKIAWEGRLFAREPLPAWRLRHVVAELPASAKADELAAAGRTAVAAHGCRRCHESAFPGVAAVPPGPSLADLGRRVNAAWLEQWLADPAKVRAHAKMPALFPADRTGATERRVLAEYLVRVTGGPPVRSAAVKSDPARPELPRAVEVGKADDRQGRLQFLSIGCVACHFVPDLKRDEQADLGRVPLSGLNDRLGLDAFAEFLLHPIARYPDGRHPKIPVSPTTARDIAAYVLMWSSPAVNDGPRDPPARADLDALARKYGGGRGADTLARAILRERRCGECHAGLGESRPADVPIRASAEPAGGCLSGKGSVRYALAPATAEAIAAYRKVAAAERHPSTYDARRALVEHYGCVRCHVRDGDGRPPLEIAASTLGGAYLQFIPFLRTPRLAEAHGKYLRTYLTTAIREGAYGARHSRFAFRMPSFGPAADAIVQALAEADGDLPDADPPEPPPPADPTLSAAGPSLVGFEGYSCVSCHLWAGRQMNEPDPGAIAPDLTTAARRIRREWFDRWLDDPGRVQPGTVMPQVFFRGQPATVKSVLEADPARQRDALWAYLSQGPTAPAPKALPPVPVTMPAPGGPPLVAQVPLFLPDKTAVEAIAVVFGSRDALVYDVGAGRLRGAYTAAGINRVVRGRIRQFHLAGEPAPGVTPAPAAEIAAAALKRDLRAVEFVAYERLADGVRIHTRAAGGADGRPVEIVETLRLTGRRLTRELAATGAPVRTQTFDLPPAAAPPAVVHPQVADPGRPEGPLERPGYKAIAYPRPRTVSGEDLVMPSAIAAHPRDGRVFVASMKQGELFVVNDPTDDGRQARFESYGGGLFQEAYSMLAESDGLYVLHRRNLTKIVESNGDGVADRFERVFGLPHAIVDAYDYGYGLTRDRTGAFVISYAPYGGPTAALPGAGGAIRLLPGKSPPVEEIAYGFRNPLGWTVGPEGEIFYTDNQGEWVATNKLVHVVPGRFYGFPNSAQREHARKPFGKTTVWVPYAWARSINGVTFDNTGGKFGPFAGQFFLAELMYGGAIIRADVEKVNGQYQGAAFPFWGRGLLGPVVLTFDPRGRLWVGSITEPGWMSQPDRGGVFRVEFTGKTPFEIQSIRIRPRGFALTFTRPADGKSAADLASYAVEHYRYEYTGAYGSPELDRTRVKVERAAVSADGRTVELTLGPVLKDRVYLITAAGVRSTDGEPPVHPAGAYTVNEVPAER